MRIKKIHIQNYKSLVDFELDTPPPFCAFVGPNASGKSNIFEALEFITYLSRFSFEAPSFFRGRSILSYYSIPIERELENSLAIRIKFQDGIEQNCVLSFSSKEYNHDKVVSLGYLVNSEQKLLLEHLDITEIKDIQLRRKFLGNWLESGNHYDNDFEILFDNFSRIFVGNNKLVRISQPSFNLLADASNLPQIIGQIFQNEQKREDFIEWVRILIPEFENIEVKQSNIDGSFEFSVFEKNAKKPFPRHLLSDGTLNILALMAAVYQSSTPQFLCIEEPENGLHPQAIELLVDFFRAKCESEGHHIWLNTHSPTLVRCMNIDEVVVVNKIDGQTRAKIDFRKKDLNLKTDEAWLTNALAGGVL